MLLVSKKQFKKNTDEKSYESLIFDLINITQNNRSQLFSNSGTWVAEEVVDTLIEQGAIQKVLSEDSEKYALTFKGIADCIRIKFQKDLEHQFRTLMELCDRKFNGTEQAALTWKEKMASLSLILLACASSTSEIRLDIEANKATLLEVFEKTLQCLRKFGVIAKSEDLKTPTSGEHIVTYTLRRMNDLARKTNLYYVYPNPAKNAGYYLDVESNGELNVNRFSFLLRRIFEHYDPECDYEEVYRELSAISQLYSPRVSSRILDQNISFSILKKLKDFTENEVMRLPMT